VRSSFTILTYFVEKKPLFRLHMEIATVLFVVHACAVMPVTLKYGRTWFSAQNYLKFVSRTSTPYVLPPSCGGSGTRVASAIQRKRQETIASNIRCKSSILLFSDELLPRFFPCKIVFCSWCLRSIPLLLRSSGCTQLLRN